MKNKVLFFYLTALAVFSSGAEERLISLAKWDFSAGSLVSTNGKYTLRVRGSTNLRTLNNRKMLQIGMSSKAEGAQFASLYKDLYSPGAFRYEFAIRMREPDSAKDQLVLFDSKYSFYRPQNHTGLALVLNRFKGNPEQYRMTVYAGMTSGNSVTFPCPNGILLKEDQTYVLAYEYNGEDTFSFFLNGKKVGAKTVKGAGAVEPPARYQGVLGDRFGSGYCHFQGDILSFQIFGIKQ